MGSARLRVSSAPRRLATRLFWRQAKAEQHSLGPTITTTTTTNHECIVCACGRASGAIRAAVWHLVGHSYEQLPQIIARAEEEFDTLVQVLLPQPLNAAAPAAPIKNDAVPITQARAKNLLHFPAANTAPALARKAG